ncbi:MAG: hypothetical protein QOF39_3337 [Frankiales bacterium]|nr:hypothetical protein [Frankiales bacterium]
MSHQVSNARFHGLLGFLNEANRQQQLTLVEESHPSRHSRGVPTIARIAKHAECRDRVSSEPCRKAPVPEDVRRQYRLPQMQIELLGLLKIAVRRGRLSLVGLKNPPIVAKPGLPEQVIGTPQLNQRRRVGVECLSQRSTALLDQRELHASASLFAT